MQSELQKIERELNSPTENFSKIFFDKSNSCSIIYNRVYGTVNQNSGYYFLNPNKEIMMIRSNITATFNADIHTVWDIVTNNEDFSWRSDLEKIVVGEDGNSFTEYTKDGYRTDFMIALKEPNSRYEFDMKNRNFTGHWTGIFSETESGGTKIDFTEELYIKNPFMKLMFYLFMNLRKMQEVYVADLRRKLGEQNKLKL